MGIEWFEAEGEVETMGDSQVFPQGRTYSVLKLRGADGRLISLERLHALARVNAVLHPGHRVRLLGFKAKGEHQAVAALTADERVDDADLLAQAGRGFRIIRAAALFLAALPFLMAASGEAYGTPIVALVAWPIAAFLWHTHGRRAALVPSRDELHRRVAAFART